MNVEGNLSESKSSKAREVCPSPALLTFLEEETKKIDEFRTNLQIEYDKTTYDKFEKQFSDLRNIFKSKSMDISDPDNEFLNHTDMRRKAVEQILNRATVVAQRFQEARENNRLDRPQCTSALEDLAYSIKNLGTLVKEQGKI